MVLLTFVLLFCVADKNIMDKCKQCNTTENLKTDSKNTSFCKTCEDDLELYICDDCGQWCYSSIWTVTIDRNLFLGVTRGAVDEEVTCMCDDECVCNDDECRCADECVCKPSINCYECLDMDNDHLTKDESTATTFTANYTVSSTFVLPSWMQRDDIADYYVRYDVLHITMKDGTSYSIDPYAPAHEFDYKHPDDVDEDCDVFDKDDMDTVNDLCRKR